MTAVRRITHNTITQLATRPLAVAITPVKEHIKVTWDDENTLIEGLIHRAADFCEVWQGRRYIETQVVDYWPAFPVRNLELRWAPLRRVISADADTARTISVAYYDTDGDSQSLVLDTGFYLMQHAVPPYIYPVPGGVWPSTETDRDDAVQVTYWAGSSGTVGGAPADGTQGILFLVGHWYRNRDAILSGTISKEIELGLKAVLGPKRLPRVA